MLGDPVARRQVASTATEFRAPRVTRAAAMLKPVADVSNSQPRRVGRRRPSSRPCHQSCRRQEDSSHAAFATSRRLGMLRRPAFGLANSALHPRVHLTRSGSVPRLTSTTVFRDLVLARIVEHSSKHDFAPACQSSHSLLYFC